MRKDPQARLPFHIDWSQWLADEDGDTITAAVWSVPTGLTSNQNEIVGPVTTVWLAGGASGVTYRVPCQITTAAGRIDRRSITVEVADHSN